PRPIRHIDKDHPDEPKSVAGHQIAGATGTPIEAGKYLILRQFNCVVDHAERRAIMNYRSGA
ncbi:hypothetical protein ACFU98_47455, partial [Streptomyces sp. NPDC057575]|uniref:hypothetical protein n=1 Tax=Streptomyces sp. NPDC057575 TaxID=3346170 RepID=UPI00369E8669